jgi:hypothetical protein
VSVETILSSKLNFLMKVREQRKTYLIKDLNLLTKNFSDLQMVMCSLLSFFIIQNQIEKSHPEIAGDKVLLGLFQEKVTEHCLSITKYGYSTEQVLSLKKLLHFCAHCCKKKSMPDEEAVFLDSSLSIKIVCETLLPVYHFKLMNELSAGIEDWPISNEFKPCEINTLEDYGRLNCLHRK